MIRGVFLAALGLAAAVLGAQTVSPALWSVAPEAAEAQALAAGKPVLLLWQAGPGAAAFTQGTERLFSSWSAWTDRVAARVVLTKARSWDSPLPSTYPLLPSSGKTSSLVLWVPGSADPPLAWTEVPPVLELSRQMNRWLREPLDDPYTLDLVEVASEHEVFTRLGEGPFWSESTSSGSSQWVEEGPLGGVLVIREQNTGQRAALPLEGDWSFLYGPAGQSWVPWNPVLVKRR